jgi:uncharacterized repeat protein (TIGR03803 family)
MQAAWLRRCEVASHQSLIAYVFDINLRRRTISLLLATSLAVVIFAPASRAQTLTVLHSFSGAEGMQPTAGITPAGPGKFYGTASTGGQYGLGSVFKLVQRGSNWVLTPIYSFKNDSDGADPLGPVSVGPDGSLFGTTIGFNDGQGTLFQLRPSPNFPATPLSAWQLTLLHTFTGQNGDGDQPVYVQLIFDQAGNIYGTTQYGGYYRWDGTVWEASPSGGGWTESVLASFDLPTNGPLSGVVMDSAGNFYGTTGDGGAVFEISPSGSGYTTTILHTFTYHDGTLAYGGLVMDQAGNLYGGTDDGGNGCGTVYELSPSGGSWTFQVLHTFQCPGQGIFGEPTLDAAGNLYGVRQSGGAHDEGQLFEMMPNNGSWTYVDLHDFTSQEGYFSYGAVVFDANGNIYGTSEAGGLYGHGTVWEFTP